jgi:hypothetical protein
MGSSSTVSKNIVEHLKSVIMNATLAGLVRQRAVVLLSWHLMVRNGSCDSEMQIHLQELHAYALSAVLDDVSSIDAVYVGLYVLGYITSHLMDAKALKRLVKKVDHFDAHVDLVPVMVIFADGM